MSFLSGLEVRFDGAVSRERDGLCGQQPNPLSPDTKTIAAGLYTEGLLCLFERFRMLNLLAFTKQPRRSCLGF